MSVVGPYHSPYLSAKSQQTYWLSAVKRLPLETRCRTQACREPRKIYMIQMIFCIIISAGINDPKVLPKVKLFVKTLLRRTTSNPESSVSLDRHRSAKRCLRQFQCKKECCRPNRFRQNRIFRISSDIRPSCAPLSTSTSFKLNPHLELELSFLPPAITTSSESFLRHRSSAYQPLSTPTSLNSNL